MNEMPSSASMSHEISLAISAENLRPLIESVLQCTGSLTGWPVGRVALQEAEAADCIGVPSHVLRDARLRLKLKHVRSGRSVLYTSAQLQAALQTMTVNAKSSEPSL
ncbi:hypothetical protein SAMN06265222_101632 [Neorhodopirellula lusitana]|uniref:DNA-binding protein n=1 Tax=Neorhodopirellula lusitana TaxID=445327 RepID=A0ABY1PT77_9BACT|nr:hypothetical protein SAMN06265222_101632 [Neorhodopirellula lusitana]